MQVRHALTHGMTSGWRAEHWPEPLKKASTRSAASVLREIRAGQHTLVIHGAISCARIYTGGAKHLAAVTAAELNETIDPRSARS